MHIFYEPLAELNKVVSLGREEAKHLSKVLRLKLGDRILITNGRNGIFEAIIKKSTLDVADLEIVAVKSIYKPREHSVHIAIAPTKNIDRIEWFVEKAVEIGIEEISFIRCERSERKNINIERLERIAISAMKQSLKASLPKINDLMEYKKFIKTVNEDQKFIAYLDQENPINLQNLGKEKNSYCILIGPEGDFSNAETALAFDNGFIPAMLGEYRLRTETAGLAACFTLNFLNQ